MFFFFKQKTAYEMRISDWSSDVCSSDLEGDVGKKLLTPRSRRSAVSWAIQHKGYSQRRACRLIGLPPKTFRRVSRRSDDAATRERLRALADQRRRFG